MTTTERLQIWRMGFVETRARGIGPDAWVRQLERVSIRPGETCDDAAWQYAKDTGRKHADVRVIEWTR